MKRMTALLLAAACALTGCVHIGQYNVFWSTHWSAQERDYVLIMMAPDDPAEPVLCAVLMDRTVEGPPDDAEHAMFCTPGDGIKIKIKVKTAGGRKYHISSRDKQIAFFTVAEDDLIEDGYVSEPVTVNELLDYIGTMPPKYTPEGLRQHAHAMR